MTNDIEALRAWHKAQLGTRENPANSNCVRYNNDYYGRQVFGAAYPWCVTYQWAAFKECGLSELFYGGGKTASCGQYIAWAKANGQWVTGGYRPGDLLFFDFTGKRSKATHIGWLDEVSGNTLYTYEGNTSSISEDNGGMVQRRIRAASQVVGAARPRYAVSEGGGAEKAVYSPTGGAEIVAVPVSAFKILMVDEKKESAAKSNYCNAGFFGNYSEQGEAFTLPVAHVKADFASKSQWVRHYIAERGTLVGGKASFDSGKWQFGNEQFFGKSISTLIVRDGRAEIIDCVTLPDCDYAISGVPVMRNGQDVAFKTYVAGQGWAADTVRATWHTFIGLKDGDDKLYVMGWKSAKSNMILSAEGYKKFKALGFRDVIKLDGGGSYVFNVGDKALSGTVENRRINSIITWGEIGTDTEDEDMGIRLDMIKRGSKGAQVKAAQAILSANGYNIGASGADGDFGAKTESATVAFQKAKGLTADGIIGDKTWERLLRG